MFQRICICACLACSSYLLAEELPVGQIMTPEQQQNIGIDRLTPAQRNAFETWAAEWTHHVLENAPTYRPGTNLTLWVQSWPAYANPTKTQLSPQEIYERQQSNQVIDRIRNNGEYIDLKDGSSWRISPFFRYMTTQWQKNQTVQIQQGTNVRHPWILNNISAGQTAEADQLAPPSPTGKGQNEPPGYYEGAVSLQSINQQGDLLSLGDGSQWKVAPMDMYKARNWNPSDRIRVEKSDNFLYKWQLSNLDTGETALANPRQ